MQAASGKKCDLGSNTGLVRLWGCVRRVICLPFRQCSEIEERSIPPIANGGGTPVFIAFAERGDRKISLGESTADPFSRMTGSKIPVEFEALAFARSDSIADTSEGWERWRHWSTSALPNIATS
jgi:hypothetical protein